MPVNWNLLDRGYDAREALSLGLTARKLGQDEARQQSTAEAGRRAAQQYGSGDLKGATQTAIASGDMDLVKQMTALQGDQRKQAGEQAELLARSARRLRSVPVEARPGELQRLAPLFSRAGFGADELEDVDLNDDALAGYEAFGTSIKDALGHELLQSRIADVGYDNERADRLASDRMRNTDSMIEDRDGRRALTARGQDLGDARGRYGIDRASEDRRRGQAMSSNDRQRGQDMADRAGKRAFVQARDHPVCRGRRKTRRS